MMRFAPVLSALVLLAVGCGGDGGSGGGGGLPGVASIPEVTSFEVDQVPRAAAASATVERTTQAATHTVLDSFTQGEATQAPHVFLAPAEFEFTAHIEKEIDLDSENRHGNDRFENLTGVIRITVDGLLSGTVLLGVASYSVLIEAATDVEGTDPDTGIVTLIPEGSSWSTMLEITWEITDSQNWLVVATSTRAIDVEGLTVTDGDVVTTISISGGREAVTAIAKIDGEVAREDSISGSVTITVDDGSEVTNILIEFQNDGLILVTINDEEFGPFTPKEFREFFGCDADDNARA